MNSELIQNHAVLAQIANVVGQEAAISMVTAFGGMAIWPSVERLEPVIGKAAAILLAKELRGAEIYIPACRREASQKRNAVLVEKFDSLTKSGLSARKAVATLAEEFCISDRRVWRILKGSGQ